MAEILKTLNPAGGGDYTLMSVAESTDQQDLVAGGNTYVLDCYAGTVTERVTWGGWVTNDTNFITIKAADGQGHGGVVGAGFILTDGATSGRTLTISQYATVVSGIQVEKTNPSSAGSTIYALEFCTIDKCISTSASTLTSHTGNIYLTNDSVVRNCLLLGGYYGIYTSNFQSSFVDNCIAVGNANSAGTGIYRDGVSGTAGIASKNNVSIGYGTAFESLGIAWGAGSTNNASDDTSAPGSAPQTGIVLTDGVDFVSPSTNDYSPTSTGKLATTGVDLSTDFTTDIAGDLRTAPWTIGAYIVAGGPPVGIQEMYIKDGGIFVKYTPYVKVGGTFQEVDAYVLDGGTWVPVHEK